MTTAAGDVPQYADPNGTMAALYRWARDQLRAAKCQTPDLDARLLVAFAIGCDPADIVLRGETPVTDRDSDRARQFLLDRLAGMPVGRITGMREFWGLEFRLSKETLEPRADTETLIEQILAWCPDPNHPWRFADIGTGTGAIAIALLSELPQALAAASDLSLDALNTARRNAERHGVANRLITFQGDFAEALAGSLDFLVSNPPYIRSKAIDDLDPQVRLYDPRLALDGGIGGLDAYRAIIGESVRVLKPGGMVFLEIGWNQAQDVTELLDSVAFENVSIYQDLGGKDRVISARCAGEKPHW